MGEEIQVKGNEIIKGALLSVEKEGNKRASGFKSIILVLNEIVFFPTFLQVVSC